MATKIETWQIVDGELKRLETTLKEAGRTEPYDLESWIASNPAMLAQDLLVIGRQLTTRSGTLDLLGIDRSGNLVIIELKRDMLPREALVQAIDYASDVGTWGLEKVGEVCAQHTGKSLEDMMAEAFPEVDLESININESQRILLVGFSIESSLERMIGWLSGNYGVSVNAVILHYIKTPGGEELLTKTTIISEELEQERAKRRKFHIEMSDEPGNYDRDELHDHVARYLSQESRTATCLRDVVLPALIKRGTVSRQDLQQELVSHGLADTTSAAGYVMVAISRVLGVAKNDHLRQVIGYGYPNYSWEKDDYHIRPDYKDFVAKILTELRGPSADGASEGGTAT